MDRVHRDAVRVRGAGDVPDDLVRVEAHSLENRAGVAPSFFFCLLVEIGEHLPARLHGEAFARQHEHFLPFDACERRHQTGERFLTLAEIVLDRFRVRARRGQRFVVGPRVVDLILGLFALAAVRGAHCRFARDDVERRLDLHGVARERHAHFHAAVERRHHRFIAGAHDRRDELLHLLEDAVAVERRQREVVDIEDDAALLILRDLIDAHRLRQRGSRIRVDDDRRDGNALRIVDLVKVRDRLEKVVLVDLEVVLRQAGDRVALLVGHDDVDVDDADVDRLRELRHFVRLRLRRRLRLGLLCRDGRRGEKDGGKDESFQREILRNCDDRAPRRFRRENAHVACVRQYRTARWKRDPKAKQFPGVPPKHE